MEQQDIGDILDRKPVEQPAPETVTDAPAEDNGIPRDEKGRFASKEARPEPAPEATGEKPQTAPPPVAVPQSPPEGYVPLAALVDQRLEARQAKQRLQELERQLREAQAPKTEPVDFYADPDAAFNQRLQQALNPFQQQLQEAKTALLEERLYRIAGGEKAAKIEQELQKAMESDDPEIQMLSHALQTQGLAAVQALVQWYDKRTFDPSAERERLKAELLAELQAEGKVPAAQAAPAVSPAAMPSNLAAARNVGTRSSGPAWSGPPSLQDIFNRK